MMSLFKPGDIVQRKGATDICFLVVGNGGGKLSLVLLSNYATSSLEEILSDHYNNIPVLWYKSYEEEEEEYGLVLVGNVLEMFRMLNAAAQGYSYDEIKRARDGASTSP
jgi:hypothetical protein